jgi:hypothetical protein
VPVLEESPEHRASPTNQQSPNSISEPNLLETESQLHLCQEMSQWGKNKTVSTRPYTLNHGQEKIEYHSGTNSITILSGIFAEKYPRRFIRTVVRNQGGVGRQDMELLGIDSIDIEYLHRKNAFLLPPQQVLCVGTPFLSDNRPSS